MKTPLVAALILVAPACGFAQVPDTLRVGIHQMESAEHRWDDLKIDPKVPELRKANELVRQGKIDEAVAKYKALSKKTNARALFNLGLVAFQRGDYRDALRWFRASYGARRDRTCLDYIRNTRRIIQEHAAKK